MPDDDVYRRLQQVPPADTMKLYARIFCDRYAPWRLVAAVGRNVLGLKT